MKARRLRSCLAACSLLGLAATLTAAPGRAEGPPAVESPAVFGSPNSPPPDSPAKALELWGKGLQEWEAKRHDEGDRYLMDAWLVSKDPWFVCMRGYLHERVGNDPNAAVSYAACEAVARKQKGASGLADKARERLQVLDMRLSRLHATASVDGAELLIDHVLLGRFPFTLPTYIRPGKYILEARKAGFQTYRIRVDFSAGNTYSEFFELKTEVPDKAAPGASPLGAPTPPAYGGSPDELLLPRVSLEYCKSLYTGFDGSGGQKSAADTVLVAGAFGVALIGGVVGVGFMTAAIGQGVDADTWETQILATRGTEFACDGITPDSQCAFVESKRTAETGFMVASAAGFTVLVAGTALAIYGLTSSKPSSNPSIVPVVSSTGGGVALVGQF